MSQPHAPQAAPSRSPCPAPRARRGAPIGAGVLQTLAVVAAVVAVGLGARLGMAESSASPSAYTRAGMAQDAEREAPARWLVDGFNVLHAGVLQGRERRGWWREEARERLLARVAGFQGPARGIWVVFDGPRAPEEPARAPEAEGLRVQVVFAPSADDWLLRAVRTAPDPTDLVVVTSDRKLADRARHRGARVISPSAFLARCPAAPGGPASREPTEL